MGRMSLRIPRLIAANSRFGLEKAIELGVPSSRLHLLPNVIDTEQFAPGPKTSSERLTILAVGRCVPQKRLDRYLSILGKVRREARIAVRGLVLGDGPLRPHLERQAAELGLAPPTVEFRGNIPDIRNAYREADILLMTSAWEGTPNVVLEAMACGLPVVATDVGGASEIIEHGTTGFLFDPEDEQAAVGLLHDLAGNATLRETIGRRAREHVAANYSLSRLSASLEMLYRSALPRPVSEDERSTR
jgi:glycosyltransferase involved in cell wall biosynthesis